MSVKFEFVKWCASALFCMVGASAFAMQKDEAGIWMAVERHEQFIRTSPRRYQDPALEEFIHSMLCRISYDSCREIRVYVVNVPGFQASMMPNGAMQIHTGLLLRMTSTSELASIVAHEYVHYKSKHSIENIRRVRKTSNAFAVMGAAVGAAGTLAAAGATTYQGYQSALDLSNSALYMLQNAQVLAYFQLIKYGRDDETESDSVGLRLISRAGYSPLAASTVWENLITEESFADKNKGFSLSSTHPSSETRMNYLRKQAESHNQEIKTRLDEEIFEYVSRGERMAWLADEVRVLHPSQFEGLIHNQSKFTDIPKGYHLYSLGKAWEFFSNRQGISKGNRKKSIKKALEAYLLAAKSQSGMPKEGYRALAKLSETSGNLALTVRALRKYLAIAPNAWDAKFVSKKLKRLEAAL